MAENGWPTEWLRALLPLCVLAVIAESETYGYAIAQRLQAGGLGGGGPGRKFFAA